MFMTDSNLLPFVFVLEYAAHRGAVEKLINTPEMLADGVVGASSL